MTDGRAAANEATGSAPAAAATATAAFGDETVKRIGFGAMQLAGPGVKGPPSDPAEAAAVLRRAIELGVDHIDTAQYYGPDTVNELIRETLHPYPEGLKLATKIGARRDGAGAWLPATSADELRDAVEENLRELRLERIDLVNLRAVDPDDTEYLERGIGVLGKLREEGKVGEIGVSSVSPEAAAHAFELADVAAVQNAFSIVDQADRPTLELCREHGAAYVPYFPLGSAFTGGPPALAEDEAIAAVAAKRDATPSQVALAWLLAQGDHVLLIPGTASVAHLEENLAAGELSLDDEDLETLRGVVELGSPMERADH